MVDKHPYAKILMDTISPQGKRITTFETYMPIHAWMHLLTHRMLSRNLQSSRAIPIKRLVKNAVFTPEYWGKARRGMSPDSQLSTIKQFISRLFWNSARNSAIRIAKVFDYIGLHKETANRVLTPFVLVKGLVTATEWDNFFKLRLDKHAQYDIRNIALQMKAALEQSTPVKRNIHMPFIANGESEYVQYLYDSRSDMVSLYGFLVAFAARCARISYANHDQLRDSKADIRLGVQLMQNGHLSPFEHIACAIAPEQKDGNFSGWRQLRSEVPEILTLLKERNNEL